jgi:hypothetical protein
MPVNITESINQAVALVSFTARTHNAWVIRARTKKLTIPKDTQAVLRINPLLGGCMYENGTKQTWRGWAWNQVQKRVPPGSLVMVLAGDSSLDIGYARKRGLECVAVDVLDECVDKFRLKGGIAVKDKIHRQLINIKPDAVILDMLGGITPTSWGSPVAASMVCKAVVWNGLRGRDLGAGRVADKIGECSIPDYTSDRRKMTKIGKHRGKMGFSSLVQMHWDAYCGRTALQVDDGSGVRVGTEIPAEVVEVVASSLRPAFYSYRSKDSGQYFDSCAWTNMQGVAEGMKESKLADTRRCRKSRRKSAAAKALLTMQRQSN